MRSFFTPSSTLTSSCSIKERQIKTELIQPLAGDYRLFEPGWAGELAPDELEFLQAELVRAKKLAFQWGFRPGAKRRPEWAIRNVAMWGDPDSRAANMALARNAIAVEPNGPNHA